MRYEQPTSWLYLLRCDDDAAAPAIGGLHLRRAATDGSLGTCADIEDGACWVVTFDHGTPVSATAATGGPQLRLEPAEAWGGDPHRRVVRVLQTELQALLYPTP